METVEQKLQTILASSEIDDDTRQDCQAAIHLLDALAFAKRLRSYSFPDSIKSELLSWKIQTPTRPKNDALEIVLTASMDGFWKRISGDAAREEE
jgi:hypothetical protein